MQEVARYRSQQNIPYCNDQHIERKLLYPLKQVKSLQSQDPKQVISARSQDPDNYEQCVMPVIEHKFMNSSLQSSCLP